MKTNIIYKSSIGSDVNSSMTSESAGTVSSTSESDGALSVSCTGRTGWSWDIRDSKLPEIITPDPFDAWPNGPCKRAYSIHSGLEASRHSSGWAMRNTNNHNVNILKKSCLGVLVCNLRCGLGARRDGSRETDLVVWRPAICDKARSKQIGQRCRTLRCSGVLELQRCQGTSGYPVTHFWRKNDRGHVFFQSKGTHNHPRPMKLHANVCGEKERVRLIGNSVEEISAVLRRGRKPYARKSLLQRDQNSDHNRAGKAKDNMIIPKTDNVDSSSDLLATIMKEEVPRCSLYVHDEHFYETGQERLENKLYSYQIPCIERASLQAGQSRDFDTIFGGGVKTTTQYGGSQLDFQEGEMEWSAEDNNFVPSFCSTVSPRLTTNSWMSPPNEWCAEKITHIQSFSSDPSSQSTLNSWASSPNKLSTFNLTNSFSSTQPTGFLSGVSYSTPTPPLEEFHSKHNGVVNRSSFNPLYVNLINLQEDVHFHCSNNNSSQTSSQEFGSFGNDPPTFNFNAKIGVSYSQEKFTQFSDAQRSTEERCELKSAKILPCVDDQWSRKSWSTDRCTNDYFYDSMQADLPLSLPQGSSQYFSSCFENNAIISKTADTIHLSLEVGENAEFAYAYDSRFCNTNMDSFCNTHIDSQMPTSRVGYGDGQNAFAYSETNAKYFSCLFANEHQLDSSPQSCTQSSSDSRAEYDYFPCTPKKVCSSYDDEKFFLTPPRSARKISSVHDDDNAVYPSNMKFDLYSLSDQYYAPLYDKSFASYDEKVLDDLLNDLDTIVCDNDLKVA